MPEHFPLLVPGAVAEGPPAEIHAPFDGALIATVDQAGPAAVEQALTTAYSLFRNRDGWLKPPERVQILRTMAHRIQHRREELAREAAREGGKPMADSLVEIDRAIDSVRLCL
jgi:acyl-CoA reductase-like NAD-dependent aldehyde dehydrogenase